MANQKIKTTSVTNKKKPLEPLKIIHLILLIGYGFVTVLTTDLNASDANGPRFLALALLNLITFIFLFTQREARTHPQKYKAFFRNDIGIVYTGLIVVSLLSFFKAFNVLESVLSFSKLFTTFSAAYLVSVLVMADTRNIKYLSVAMTMLLIYDSLDIISGINQYIQGKISSISDIKSVYFNKNGLASAVFVKIPFAIWLMAFNTKWFKAIGILGTFLALLGTLFQSTRAFYLGLIALSFLLVIFLIIRYKLSNDKYQLKITGIYIALLVSTFLIFNATQHYLYPRHGSGYDVSVKERLETITASDGGGGRLDSWKRSWHVFKEDPILGVGLGNWKILTQKEDNLTSKNLETLVYAHNDFIQTTTETGIIGGLLFISIFLLMGWGILKVLFRNDFPEWQALIFLPALGLFCYSFDAFFNFPHDRPEIQSLFALYLGLAVSVTSLYLEDRSKLPQNHNIGKVSLVERFQFFLREPFLSNATLKPNNNFYRLSMSTLFGLMLSASIYILYQNLTSLRLQRMVLEEIYRGKLTLPASLFLEGFPTFPNLNSLGEPIAVQKARYLINEKRNEEALVLLKNDKSSPYNPLVEYYIAMAYQNQNNIDSSLVHWKKLCLMKPNFFESIPLLCNLLQQKGMQQEGEVFIDRYLSKTKKNKAAWLYAHSFYDKNGNIQKATSVIDSAIRYFPSDSEVMKQKMAMDRKADILPYQEVYLKAIDAFKEKKYDDAIRNYTELLNKEPSFAEARVYRAFCFQSIKEYAKSNFDLDLLIPNQVSEINLYNPYNLRGVNYWFLGNREAACKNFKIASDMGDKEGMQNYTKLCK